MSISRGGCGPVGRGGRAPVAREVAAPDNRAMATFKPNTLYYGDNLTVSPGLPVGVR